MNPKLEAAINELRKAADKVFVEYDCNTSIIVISAANQEGMEGSGLAVKKKKFFKSFWFNLGAYQEYPRYKFSPESEISAATIYMQRGKHDDLEPYCEVEGISEESVLLKLFFLNAKEIKQKILFTELNFLL